MNPQVRILQLHYLLNKKPNNNNCTISSLDFSTNMSTRSKKGILFSLVLLILYTTHQKTIVQGGATGCVTFEKLSPSSGLSLDVVTSCSGVSRRSCASRCQSSVKRQGYFTYNAAQQTCACGVNLLSSPLAQGESLYAPKCDRRGYTLYVRGTACVCVKLVESSASYSMAKSTCWRDGEAYLYMPDTADKRKLIDEIKDTDTLWLGMDDLEEEGVWRFNDGRQVTQDIIDTLRDGNKQHTDCVRFYKSSRNGQVYYFINDCTQMDHYICEIPIE